MQEQTLKSAPSIQPSQQTAAAVPPADQSHRQRLNLSAEQYERVKHILTKNNLPTEEPTLRLDIKPVQSNSGMSGTQQLNTVSATPTVAQTNF